MSKKLSKTQEVAPVALSLHAMKERRQVLELFRARRTYSQALSYTNAWVWLDREIARYDALIDAAEPVQSDTVPFLSSPDGDDLTWEELTAPTQLDLGEIQRERETRIINGLRVPAQFVADAPRRKSVHLYELCPICEGIGTHECLGCHGQLYVQVGLTTGQFDHYIKMREQAEERLQVVRDELVAASARIAELEANSETVDTQECPVCKGNGYFPGDPEQKKNCAGCGGKGKVSYAFLAGYYRVRWTNSDRMLAAKVVRLCAVLQHVQIHIEDWKTYGINTELESALGRIVEALREHGNPLRLTD